MLAPSGLFKILVRKYVVIADLLNLKSHMCNQHLSNSRGFSAVYEWTYFAEVKIRKVILTSFNCNLRIITKNHGDLYNNVL
jgi:hypothetical protein